MRSGSLIARARKHEAKSGMPNYRGVLGHKNQTIVAAVALIAIPVLTRDVTNVLIPLGCLAGLKVSPDWDLNPGALGWLGRLLFVDEYAELVPHRSKISHGPLYGTLIRFALLASVPVTTAFVTLFLILWYPPLGFFAALRHAFVVLAGYFWVLGKLFAGLLMADLLHICSDRLESKLKKLGGKTWKKVNLRRRRKSQRWRSGRK